MARKKKSSLRTAEEEAKEEIVNEGALPDGCHHYEFRQDVPWNIQKYFDQRYSIFSEYDRGIWMTDDAWFGVTPEPVANKIAEHLAIASPPDKDTLIDVFGGVGGNCIAFARSGRWKRVHVIERDAQTIACAKHNAEVYGVSDLISWYHGDCFEVLKGISRDLTENTVLFASPPWGGPGYRIDEIFDLSQMQPYNLTDLLWPFREVTKNIVLYLPRTSDLRQVARLALSDTALPSIHYCMEGASKALCVYFGDLAFDDAQDIVMDG